MLAMLKSSIRGSLLAVGMLFLSGTGCDASWQSEARAPSAVSQRGQQVGPTSPGEPWLHRVRSLTSSQVRAAEYDPQGNLIVALEQHGTVRLVGETLPGATHPEGGVLTLVKLRPDGSLVWRRTFTSEGAGSMQLDALTVDLAGNIALGGTAEGTWALLGGTARRQSFIARLSASGERTWGRYTRPQAGTRFVFNDLGADSTGDIVALATFWPDEADAQRTQVMLIHYVGSSGEPAWDRLYGPPQERLFNAQLALDEADNIYILGAMAEQLAFGEQPLVNASGCSAAYLASFDARAQHRWSRAVVLADGRRGYCDGGPGGIAVQDGRVVGGFAGQLTFAGVTRAPGDYALGYDARTGAEQWIRPLRESDSLAPPLVERSADAVVVLAYGDAAQLGEAPGRAEFFSAALEARDGGVRHVRPFPAGSAGSRVVLRSFDAAPSGATSLAGALQRGSTEFGIDFADQEGVEEGFVLQTPW